MRSRFRRSRALAVCTATIALMPLVPGGAAAQPPVSAGALKGTVRSAAGLPIGGAQLRLQFPAGIAPAFAETDDNGAFSLLKVPAGPAWLIAKRIGFRPDSVRVSIGEESAAITTVALERIAVELETVRVLGRRDLTGHMAGFYRRQEYGNGRFFTAYDLERRNSTRLTDVLRMVPGLRIETRGFNNAVRMRGSRCAPLVWLDNQPLYAGEIDLDVFDARSFDGIEIYSGASTVPVEFQGNQRMSSACGTIVLWSKRGELRERKRKKDEPTPASRIATMLAEGAAFVAADVDAAARPDSLLLVRPVYPDSLFEAQIAGRVIAEFVVNPGGDANMDTFSAVTTTHRLLVEPVRRAVRDQRFVPAVRGGRPVQQVLQLPFEFVPDSTARRKR